MKINALSKFLYYTFAPLAIFGMLAVVPVSHAAADSVAPADVENAKATPGDASVTLTWNVATDNVGVKGYRVYYGQSSVTNEGGNYTTGPVDAGNKINYVVKSLQNDKKYYFAVTAYDAAGNESENYSPEVSATPTALKATATDKEAPKVSKAEAVTQEQVKVTFSEAIQLPTIHPESAFSIKNDAQSTQLMVSAATMDSSDTTHKTVLLTTAIQEAEAPYILTAGIDIKDKAGNPIVSGTSDTAPFTGSGLKPAAPEAPVIEGPKFISVQATDSTHVEVVFSKAVVLKTDKRENFAITEKQNVESVLEITAVDVSTDGSKVTLTTAPQKDMTYNLIALNITDADKNAMSVENNATEFAGKAAEVVAPGPDTTPPEDVTKFTAKMIKNLIVTLNWMKSINSAQDLANYVLYMSTDGQNYGPGISIDPKDQKFDVLDLVPGMKYFFKLTTKDVTGNESQGAFVSFTLPKTGPELALLLLGSLGLGKVMKKRKKALKK